MVNSMAEKKEYEEITIDLSKVPVSPVSKRDIQRLEMALIIGTLYSPEVLELIRDPIERATWVDSLAVAAAALARSKAGYSIGQIADEVGRSETSIRAHLTGKTKAGQLVLKTYEKLVRGELKVIVPFAAKAVAVPEDIEKKLKELEEERKKLLDRIKQLEEELQNTRKELEEKIKIIEEIKKLISAT